MGYKVKVKSFIDGAIRNPGDVVHSLNGEPRANVEDQEPKAAKPKARAKAPAQKVDDLTA